MVLIGTYRHVVTLDDPRTGPLDPALWDCAVDAGIAQVVDGVAAHVFRGRYHPGITLETVIGFEGATYHVQSVVDVDLKHVEHVLIGVEVVGRHGTGRT